MRLDFPLQPGQGSVGGLEDLEQLIKAAIKASFETRAAAYEEEVSSVHCGTVLPVCPKSSACVQVSAHINGTVALSLGEYYCCGKVLPCHTLLCSMDCHGPCGR